MAENSEVFKWNLKKTSEKADREFHTEGTVTEKARDEKLEATITNTTTSKM